MKVLFVGNSHTFFFFLPELFAQFAEKTTGEKPSVAPQGILCPEV